MSKRLIVWLLILTLAIVLFVSWQRNEIDVLNFHESEVQLVTIYIGEESRQATDDEREQLLTWLKAGSNIKRDEYGGRVTTPDGRIVMMLANGDEYKITIHRVNQFVLTKRTNNQQTKEYIVESAHLYEFLRSLESW